MNNLWVRPDAFGIAEFSSKVCNFLDVATTSYGRATHYNTREQQQAAELSVHDELLVLNRDLYAVLLCLPGVTDRSMQLGAKKLLSTPRDGIPNTFITAGQERAIIQYIINELPAQRLMKLFDAFRIGNESQGIHRANNARTRKLILTTFFSSPRLQLWVVKYRSKVKRSLTHAWGKKLSSIIANIVSRDERLWSDKEKRIIKENIGKYIPKEAPTLTRTAYVYECVRFAFGLRDRLTLPLFTAFERSKIDLHAGSRLPMEVLEGIRSTYHKELPKEKVLEVVKDNLTTHQKMAVQKRAGEAKIKVEMDPLDYDAVKLYIYAFEQGLTNEISEALTKKAKKAAKGFPARFNSVGIIVDASASMAGDKTQPLRPLAVALAMRDMLIRVGGSVYYTHCGGKVEKRAEDETVFPPPRPSGDTELAGTLIDVMSSKPEPDAVFVISDGYENAPAGRFDEVVSELRRLNIMTPIYHLNPVFAAETNRCKELSKHVSTMPAKDPKSMGTMFIRSMMESDPGRGINILVDMAMRARGFLGEPA